MIVHPAHPKSLHVSSWSSVSRLTVRVGFLARGRAKVEFPDGCTCEYIAPAADVLEAGHRDWVVGSESAVLVEMDFRDETSKRGGLPAEHRHE